MVIVTNTHSESAVSPAALEPRPASTKSTVAATAESAGQRNVRTRLRGEARRQAIIGPTPVRNRSGSPKMTRKKS